MSYSTSEAGQAPALDNFDRVDIFAGQRLRARRLLLRLTQEALGKACGISGQQVHKYEIGQSRMTIGRASVFADRLDVPPSYFFETGEGRDLVPADLTEMLGDPTTAQILVRVAELSPSARHGLLGFLAALSLRAKYGEEADAAEHTRSTSRSG